MHATCLLFLAFVPRDLARIPDLNGVGQDNGMPGCKIIESGEVLVRSQANLIAQA